MKILLEAMHGMGDVICMIPKFECIAQKYPQAEFTILFNNKISEEVVKASNFKNFRSIIINAHNNRLSAFKQCLHLRKENYDLAFFSPNTPTKKYNLFVRIIQPKKCVSIQDKGLYYNLIQDKYHFVDANLLSLGINEINRDEWQPRIFPDSSVINQLVIKYHFNITTKYIGISVGTGDVSYKNQVIRKNPIHTRGWGDDKEHVTNMCSLIKNILEEGYNVVLFGGKLEEHIIDCFPTGFLKEKRIINLVGKLTMTESIAAASMCSVMVGVDTGMQHVSDALGKPTVSIFGPTNPLTHGAYSSKAVFAETNAPCKYCYGTSNYVNCNDRKCLSNIKEVDVMNLIKKQLEVYYEIK